MKLLKILLAALVLHCLPLKAEIIVLTTDNTIALRGPIDGTSAAIAQLKLFEQAVKRGSRKYPLYLVIDSPGGEIEASNMFIQFAKTIPNLTTISIFSASMASAIVEQLPGERLVTENGTLMFHKAMAGLEGTVETGSLESRLWHVKQRVLRFEMLNANRMKMSIGDYKATIANELWLDADSSVLYRAADRIVDIVCTENLVKQTSTLQILSFFGAMEFKFSSCPLFRAPTSGGSDKIKYMYGPNAIVKK